VTCAAESDQVLFRIVARVTAELLVVYLKLLQGATPLAAPTVARQNLSAQLPVGVRFQL